jgi:diaminohydroxyphosphoribosylaminopyrimidine deaminase / 5-amino-6-(5-phosphoribosylamino)uracil reductase
VNQEYLELAFQLAEKGRGMTNPNPMVGAVVVNGGVVAGQGYHAKAGLAHAEIEALTEAGDRARGGSLYVSLEPCRTHGRTPPCTDAIIEAGIREVFVGLIDPNPKVSGRGMQTLKDSGIKVELGQAPPWATNQNEVYVKHITTGRPFLLLKSAVSFDGKIAAKVGSRTYLTQAEAGREVHRLRNEYDAVMVGIGTVLADDPLLTCRLSVEEPRQPARIVVDSAGRLPLDSRLVQTANEGPVILAATDRLTAERRAEFTERGIDVIICRPDKMGRVDLDDLLQAVGKRGIVSVMAEGGGELNQNILERRLADKVVVFMAPVIVGGNEGLSMSTGAHPVSVELQVSGYRLVGPDLMIEAYPIQNGRGRERAGQRKVENCFQE